MNYLTGIALTLVSLGSLAQANYKENSALFSGTYTENYVNRWGFQERCDHVYDPRTSKFLWPTKSSPVTLDPALVKAGDTIFVRDVGSFIKKLHPSIKYPYIMVTAGEFRDAVQEKFMRFLDNPNIIAWLSVHACPVTHPKFHMLPLGIYQDRKFYEPRAELTQKFAQWRKAPKTGLLYSNFGDIRGMKPERAEVGALFDDAPYCYKAERLPFLEYMEEMSKYRFTLSPLGYGPDSYRNWEAMLVGSIPIVRSTHLDPLYADLPVLIVKEWSEVHEEFLHKKYEEISAKRYNIEKLFMEYWWKKIQNIREQFLAGYAKKGER